MSQPFHASRPRGANHAIHAASRGHAQTAASALLKLQPTDPLLPIRWVLDACAAAEDLVPFAAAAVRPEAIPAFGAPQAEGWAEAHALLTTRLFRA